MTRHYFFLLTILLAIACSNKDKVPKGVLPQPKMGDVLWDMISAGEHLNGFVLIHDSIDRQAESAKEYAQVLRYHHITKEEFERSYLFYRQHPALMKVILDTLSKRQTNPEELFQSKSDTIKKVDTPIVTTQPVVIPVIPPKPDTARKRLFKRIKKTE